MMVVPSLLTILCVQPQAQGILVGAVQLVQLGQAEVQVATCVVDLCGQADKMCKKAAA